MVQSVKVILATSAMLWVIAVAAHARGRTRALAWGLTLGVLAVQLRSFALIFLDRETMAKEWDYLCFWVWGHMGAHGLDFYDPANGAAYTAGRTTDFIAYILDVGFWYPPPTMLLFAPLGLFTPSEALFGWSAVQILALLGSAYLAFRLFAPDTRALGLLATLAFLLVLPGTRQTLAYAQTHALVLLLSLSILRWHRWSAAGAFAVAALVVKPFLVFWLGFLALSGRWRALGVAAATSAGTVVVTGAVFGFSHFASYTLDNPMERAPVTVYSEGVNQSLFATILRETGSEQRAREPLVRVMGLLGASLVLLPALVASWFNRKRDPLLVGALLLSAVLVVYPFTLMHYSMLMAPALLLLWSRRATLAAGPFGAALGIVLLAVLSGLGGGLLTFWAHLALFAWVLTEAWLLKPATLETPAGAPALMELLPLARNMLFRRRAPAPDCHTSVVPPPRDRLYRLRRRHRPSRRLATERRPSASSLARG